MDLAPNQSAPVLSPMPDSSRWLIHSTTQTPAKFVAMSDRFKLSAAKREPTRLEDLKKELGVWTKDGGKFN